MSNLFFEKPVLNSAYAYLKRHSEQKGRYLSSRRDDCRRHPGRSSTQVDQQQRKISTQTWRKERSEWGWKGMAL